MGKQFMAVVIAILTAYSFYATWQMYANGRQADEAIRARVLECPQARDTV